MTTVKIVPAKFENKDDAERTRGLRAAECFDRMLAIAKDELASKAPNALTVNWYALGMGEAEAAMRAWHQGAKHPFFEIWEGRRGTTGSHRSPPSSTELEARRMTLLLCVALERVSFNGNMQAARECAARALDRVGLFARPPSAATIEHWQRDYPLTLDARAEQTLAWCIAACGPAPHKICSFFTGLAHLVFNPAPQVTFEP